MSTKAKLTLAGSVVIAGTIVTYVHAAQVSERRDVRTGVIADLERQEKKKQNLVMIEEQQKLTEVLKQATNEQKS